MADTDMTVHSYDSETNLQRRLARECDAWDITNPAVADLRHRRTLLGLADVDAGRLIDDATMQAWTDSLGTDLPQSG